MFLFFESVLSTQEAMNNVQEYFEHTRRAVREHAHGVVSQRSEEELAVIFVQCFEVFHLIKFVLHLKGTFFIGFYYSNSISGSGRLCSAIAVCHAEPTGGST